MFDMSLKGLFDYFLAFSKGFFSFNFLFLAITFSKYSLEFLAFSLIFMAETFDLERHFLPVIIFF